ncbi:MAG: aldo/keto reductase [Candidatus Aminicenantes bacterium]|nr:aldo/keto reductase [Candidatus Aminicenantes bacterium]
MRSESNRRTFLRSLGAGTLGLGLSGKIPAWGAASSGPRQAAEEPAPPRIKKYNPLGRTGISVADVSFGAINLLNPNVLRYAYDCGVNYYDTAEGYLNQNSERYLGQALKDVRGKVIITTKHGFWGGQDMKTDLLIKRVEASLGRLQTDYLDIALMHAIDDPAKLDNKEVREAYRRLKKDGKIRFAGFSTHNAAVTLPKVLEDDFFEVVLLVYNHLEGPKVEPLLSKVREKGVGTIAMKVFAGGMQGNLKSLVNERLPYSQAAIRWVLGHPAVDCCIVTMSTFSHVEEYVAASGQRLDRADLAVISRYQEEAGPLYCRVSCSECLAACPNGVAVNDVLRYRMYFENYGQEKNAMGLYAALDERRKPHACAGCAAPCLVACPYSLQVRERLIEAHALLA